MKLVKWLGMIVLFCCNLGIQAQDEPQLKKFDRAKWKELVKEIKQKRYDPREPKYENSQNPESEYYNMENQEFSDEASSSNYSTDEGIYDGTSTNDRDFFNESNDKLGKGEGAGNGGNGEPDPRYNDNPSSGGSNNGGSQPSYQETQPKQIQRAILPPKAETRAAGSGGDSTWLLFVMIGVLAAAVIYMIIVSFNGKNKKVTEVTETNESKLENLTITKSELELALEAALANKNYREAVRIYFIAVIKEMKERSWIKWEKKKTNYHYINEISGRAQQPDFITVTRAFEIVWYGNRSLAENEYRQIEPHFKKLLSSINA